MTPEALERTRQETGVGICYLPPQGLKDYLAGSWVYLRLLDDRRAAQKGNILGCCVFRACGEALHYHERGRLAFAGTVANAQRSYLYAFFASHRAQVLFADGRPFHTMDVSKGESSFHHDCPPDLYRGTCRLTSAQTWQLTWRVTGPRKNLVLATHYRRFADPLGCFRAIAGSAY